MKGRTHIVWITLLATLILLAAPASAQDTVWQYDAIIPWDAERLTNNNTLVTEYGNHTVIEVNTTTKEIIWQYGGGTSGSGVNQLNSPVDAERLSNNNTLITDRNNHRVIEVNTTGTIVWQYGTTGASGSGYDQLYNPMDAERLSGGNTLIADRLNNRVIEVNESKGIVWQYGITNPFDADRLSNGNTLIVEYTNHRAIEINESDEIVWQYGGASGSGVNQLNNPMDAERLANGNTLIADYINDRVIEVRTSDYDQAEADNGFTAESIVWGYESNHPADAERLASGSTLICEAGNNSVIEIAYEIDLLPTALEIPTLYDNITNIIRATILNNRTGDASSFNVSLCADGNPVDEVEVSGLDAGESTVVNLYWTPSETGDVELCVTADCDLAVDESDEDNNLLCGNVTVFSFEHPCWNDTFDDETKIAGKVNVVVSGGDVELDNTTLGQGSITSVVIQPYLSYFKNWTVFNVNDTVPAGTNITYKILSASNSTVMSVVDGQDISGITQQSVRLFAELTTTNSSLTPVLHDWGVCWETGEVDLLPTVIETSPELYSNVSWRISVTIKNNGSAHSGRFNTTLYANDSKVGTMLIDDMSAGADTIVTFEWTPDHAGDYNLIAIADSEGVIVESDEANNSLTTGVTVLPSNMRRLTFDPGSSVSPSVAADSMGNQHVVWVDDRDGEGYRNAYTWYPCPMLYYKKLAPDGTVLVSDTRLTQPAESPVSSITPAIAIDSNDNVCVAWSLSEFMYRPWPYGRYYKTNDSIYYLKLDNNGNMLIEPKQAIPGMCKSNGDWVPTSVSGFAVDSDDNAHIVWFLGTPGKLPSTSSQWIIYVKLDNEGSELVNHTLEYICSPPYGTWDSMNAPSGIAVDSDGNAYTTYSKGLGACAGSGCPGFACRNWPACAKAWYVKIDADGVHKQDLTGDLPLPSLYPSVCVDSGDNKYVIWSQHNRSGTVVCNEYDQCYTQLYGFGFYLTKFDKSGNKVINSKRITYENYSTAVSPIIDTESGVIHVTWSQESNIHYMTFDTSGSMLTNRTLVSLEDGSSWEPDIDACPDGAHLVWTDNRDLNNEIYYARLLLPPDRVFLMPPPDRWTPQTVNATYTIGVMSTMSNTETFDLTFANLDNASVAEISNSTITLDQYAIGEVTLNVTDADVGDYRVTVSATSQTNPEINTSATITTTVIVPEADLIITAIDAYHNGTGFSPYFNLSNEVDVTVKNIGTASAGAFNVSLYADGGFVDKQTIPDLGHGSYTVVQLKWTPIGMDCEDGGSQQTYTLKAIADCDNDTVEMNEANNESTTEEIVYWAGYSADEHINGVAWHGMLHGGLHYTTGDGYYSCMYSPGTYVETDYSITVPSGASVELARLNVYYTWSKLYSTGVYPVMEISITNTSGTYVVPINASYSDRPCDSPAIAYEYPFGNYVYDLTPYITGDGSYTVNVKNVGPTDYSFCIAAPGIVILYEDDTKPEYEFWILEGADLLEGGRRCGAGNLDLSECICNATFTGEVDTNKVETATLGIVSAWGGAAWGADWTSYYWFNDHYIGDGSMLGGYSSAYDETVNCMSIHVANAQVGANVSDVTCYITDHDNLVSFGDDGDSMMPVNAFLALERGSGTSLTPLLIYGRVSYPDGSPANDSDVVITNLNTSDVLAVETATDSNYYQAVTSSQNVNVGDVLNFNASNGNVAELNHTVTSEDMDDGCFVQNLTVGHPGICGDVNGDREVDMTDVMTVWYDFADYPYPGAYTISDAWAADVNCDGYIDMTDVMTIWYDFADYPYMGAYEVNCCG